MKPTKKLQAKCILSYLDLMNDAQAEECIKSAKRNLLCGLVDACSTDQYNNIKFCIIPITVEMMDDIIMRECPLNSELTYFWEGEYVSRKVIEEKVNARYKLLVMTAEVDDET